MGKRSIFHGSPVDDLRDLVMKLDLWAYEDHHEFGEIKIPKSQLTTTGFKHKELMS